MKIQALRDQFGGQRSHFEGQPAPPLMEVPGRLLNEAPPSQQLPQQRESRVNSSTSLMRRQISEEHSAFAGPTTREAQLRGVDNMLIVQELDDNIYQ